MEQSQLHPSHKDNKLYRKYILPDYNTVKEGYVVDRDTITEAQIKELNQQSAVNLTNERFQVPEILFSPSDIGINQLGVAEIIK